MHTLIRTEHGAHSLRKRSNNGNDTLLIRYLYVRSSSRCDHNFVRRMPPCRNRTFTVLRTNIPYELRSVNERSAYWPFVGGDTIFPMMEVTPKTIKQNSDSSIYLYRTHFLYPTRFYCDFILQRYYPKLPKQPTLLTLIPSVVTQVTSHIEPIK